MSEPLTMESNEDIIVKGPGAYDASNFEVVKPDVGVSTTTGDVVATNKDEKQGVIPRPRNRIDINQLMELPRSERRRIGKILKTKINGIDRVDRTQFVKNKNT